MRSLFVRVLAGVLGLLALVCIPYVLITRSGRDDYPFGIGVLISGLIIIVPTFFIYAFGGEKKANRALAFSSRLVTIPQMLLGKLISRFVEIPPELEEPSKPKELKKTKEKGA